MSIADKLTQIAENEQKVYDAGRDKANLDFWNGFTSSGDRVNYYYAFMNCNFSGLIIPEGLCRPYTRVTYMFYQYNGQYLPKGIDCSRFDITKDSGYHASCLCQFSTSLKEFYDINLPVQKTYSSAFGNCYALQKIEVLRSDENTVWTNAFTACNALSYLRIEGVIGQAFSVSGCTNLDHDSLMSIIEALKNIKDTGITRTCSLGSTNLAKLTTAEKAIATDERGWSLT